MAISPILPAYASSGSSLDEEMAAEAPRPKGSSTADVASTILPHSGTIAQSTAEQMQIDSEPTQNPAVEENRRQDETKLSFRARFKKLRQKFHRRRPTEDTPAPSATGELEKDDLAYTRLTYLFQLSSNPVFQEHYYAMSGDRLPPPQYLEQIIRERNDPSSSEATKAEVDPFIIHTSEALNKILSEEWGALPQKIRDMFPTLTPQINQIDPGSAQEMIEIIYAHNLAAFGHKDQFITTKEQLFESAKTAAEDLSNPKNSSLMIVGGEYRRFLPLEAIKDKNLQHLIIWQTNIRFLPKEITDLPFLETLNVMRNRISSLPEEIGKLTTLRILGASNNQLHALPRGITSLENLVQLGVDDNKLEALPVGIEDMPKLELIKFSNNQITSIPHFREGVNVTDQPQRLV